MIFLISCVFTVLWFLWTIIWGILCMPILFYKKGNRIIFRTGYVWAKITLLLLKYTCKISHEVIGTENIPNNAFIAASKHQSAWETILFLYLFKEPVLIIKKELTNIPIYGWYLNKMSMIIIDRNKGINAIKQMKYGVQEAINNGRPIIIFPEGTRTCPKHRIPYKSGIKFLYDEFGNTVPIIPIALNSGKYWINKSIIKKPGIIKVKIMQATNLKSNSEFLKNLQNIIDGNSEDL